MSSIQIERALNPFPFYKRMRESQPLLYQEEMQRWQVFCYAEAEQVLTNAALFSSAGSAGSDPDQASSTSLLHMDPPQHRQFRNLVSQAFTPRTVAQLTDRMITIVTHLLDEVAAAGTMDIVEQLAYPLPIIVIAELLGIPSKDRALFKEWSDIIVSSIGGQKQYQDDLQQTVNNYFIQVMEERRKQPEDDLISALLNAQVDGQYLTQQELFHFCILLLVAGNETTTNLIGNALLCFLEQPEVLEQLYEEPELMPMAIEEILRYRSPVQFTGRTATANTQISGQQIKAGQSVIVLLGSANRDAAQFSDPERFDIRRTPNRHLAFGHGIHFCLGAPLARLEAKIVLSALLARFQDIQCSSTIPLEAVEGKLVYGVKHLPITFKQR